VEHKVNPSELLDMKKLIGVYVEGQNYNHIVGGHGTGLKPPSASEWNAIGDNLFVVDSISSSGTNLGSPVSDDESSKPWFPPIGNQDGQGSCTTWSVGYYTKTFQEALEHNWDLSGATWQGGSYGHPTPSYQNEIASPAFIYNLINSGVDQGSSFPDAMQLVCFVGDSTWQTMPYNTSDYSGWPSEQAWTEAPLFRGNSSGYQYMSLTNDAALSSLKTWISSDHLATIAVDANQYVNLTSSDLWTTDTYVNPQTDHANTIVGYNDSMSYVENGTPRYGAFKVANSWGVGGWEKVPDGFYWISYAAMKQRVLYCCFYYDMIGYNPTLEATFQINHSDRSACDIQVGIGDPNSPISTKSFSQYVYGGAHPFCQNNIVFDITEFQNSVSTINGQTFFLRVLDHSAATIGTITTYSINQQNSNDAPCQTVDQKPVYLNLTFGLPATASLVVRGGDNRIYYRMYSSTSASWYGWNSLPTGTTLDSPAAAYADKLYVVVRGSDGSSLWFSSVSLTDSSFSGWTLLTGSTPSPPTLTSNGTNLALVVRGGDNRIYYRLYTITSQTWTAWSFLPSGTTQDTPKASLVGNTLHIVVRGSDGSTMWYSNIKPNTATFSGWTLLSGSTPSTPTLTSNGTTLDLIVRGGDNRTYYCTYTIASQAWTSWNALPSGTTLDTPAATILQNSLYFVVRGSDGTSLWTSNINLATSSFSGWTWLSGSTPSKPTLTS
jgi:hypothetical protein